MTAPAKATPLDYFASRLRGRAKIALASDSEYDEFVIVENADDAKALCTLLARCERLEVALTKLVDLYARPGESNVDRFERVAEMFYRETGCMAPGKDVAAASGDNMTHEERRERWERWEAWYTERAAAARAALEEKL